MFSEPEDGGFDARVFGVLPLSESGCVKLGDRFLLAPWGSSVSSSNPPRIRLPELGEFALGETVSGAGGELDTMRSAALDEPRLACLDEGNSGVGFVTIRSADE